MIIIQFTYIRNVDNFNIGYIMEIITKQLINFKLRLIYYYIRVLFHRFIQKTNTLKIFKVFKNVLNIFIKLISMLYVLTQIYKILIRHFLNI